MSEINFSTHLFNNALECTQKIVADGLINVLNTFRETEKSLLTIEELARPYGNTCDETIINSFKKESLTYVSGAINIVLIDEDYFFCSTTLYFQDNKQKWILKETSSDKKLLEKLTKESILELKEKKLITFDVTAPKESKI